MHLHLILPCGGTAHFDEGSGIGYRCECGSVLGSIGMPKHCSDIAEQYKMLEMLGGRGWDYANGRQLET
jgi:hypothetical protein